MDQGVVTRLNVSVAERVITSAAIATIKLSLETERCIQVFLGAAAVERVSTDVVVFIVATGAADSGDARFTSQTINSKSAAPNIAAGVTATIDATIPPPRCRRTFGRRYAAITAPATPTRMSRGNLKPVPRRS